MMNKLGPSILLESGQQWNADILPLLKDSTVTSPTECWQVEGATGFQLHLRAQKPAPGSPVIYEVLQTGLVMANEAVRLSLMRHQARVNGVWRDVDCQRGSCTVVGQSCLQDLSCKVEHTPCTGSRYISFPKGVLYTKCGGSMDPQFIHWSPNRTQITVGDHIIENPNTFTINQTVMTNSVNSSYTHFLTHPNLSHFINNIITDNKKSTNILGELQVNINNTTKKLSFLQLLVYIGAGFVSILVLIFATLIVKLFNYIVRTANDLTNVHELI